MNAETLAQHLRVASERRIAWTEVTLPDGGRADVLAIRPRRERADVAIYEVKASRSDFWSDVNEGKFRRYEAFCHRGYFAVPSGLVRKDEVPEGWGLITWREAGWRVVKPATSREMHWDHGWLVSLLDRTWFEDVRSARRLQDAVEARENAELRLVAWRLGRSVSERLWRLEAMERDGGASPEAREALRFARLVLEAATASGVTSRHGEPLTMFELDHLAGFAVAMLREASTIREIGRYLSVLPTAKHAPLLPD